MATIESYSILGEMLTTARNVWINRLAEEICVSGQTTGLRTETPVAG